MTNWKLYIAMLFTSICFGESFKTNAYAGIFDYTTFITVEDDTAQKAKEQAIIYAREKALLAVLQKITLAKDLDKIKSLLTDQSTAVFMQGFRIANEDIQNRSYSANITFTFNNQNIYKFLQTNDIRYITKKDNRVLVIPVLTKKGATTATSFVSNEWSSYWLNVPSDDYLSTFIYYNPPGGISFLSNPENLENVKNNLDIKDVFLVTLDDTNGALSLNIFSFTTKESISVKVDSLESAVLQAVVIMEQNTSEVIIKRLSSNEVDYDFKFVYISFDKWLQMKRVMQSILNTYEIKEIGPNYTLINIKYRDSIAKLKERFLEQCLFLDEDDLSFYIVKNC